MITHGRERRGPGCRHAASFAFGILILAACAVSVSAVPALAAGQDSWFEYSPDGAKVDFQLRDVPRREALEHLLAGTGIAVTWINPSFAEQLITGTFKGSREAVARQLLSETDFIIGYTDKSEIARVVIVGPAGKTASPGLALLAGAIQKGAIAEATRGGAVAFPGPGTAVPQMVPSRDFPPLPTPGSATAVAPVPGMAPSPASPASQQPNAGNIPMPTAPAARAK